MSIAGLRRAFKLSSSVPQTTAPASTSRLAAVQRQFSSTSRTMAPTTEKYDYIVIGGGSGGSGAARRASGWYKKKTALMSHLSEACPTQLQRIERACARLRSRAGALHRYSCGARRDAFVPLLILQVLEKSERMLNREAQQDHMEAHVSTSVVMTWNAASIAEYLHHASAYHYTTGAVDFSFRKFVEDRTANIKGLNGAYSRNWSKDGITTLDGHASFVSDHELEIKPLDGSASYRLEADHITIATGSYATVPKDIEGAQHGITSDEFFLIKELPKSMVFVGAGYISVELAGMMAALGVEVHMFIRGETFLRKFDPMVQQVLTNYYEKMGIRIHKSHPGIKKIELLNPAKDESDPREKQLKITSADGSELITNELLWAIGRGAETRGLGLENTGVELDDSGHVVVDKFQNTTVDGIYAIGDITGQAELTPVAIAAGRQLGNRLFSGKEEYRTARIDYENIPTVVFAHPTVGTTGLTEPEAVERFGKENVKVYETKFGAMFYSFHEKDKKPPTSYKLIVHGPEERVCGLHMIGDGSDEAMQAWGVVVRLGARKQDLDSTIAIHPTSQEELVTMMPGMAREGRA